jgi:hypothetical protein
MDFYFFMMFNTSLLDGSISLMTHLWPVLMAWSGYRIQFLMEMESDSAFPFMDILVITLPTHIGQYLTFSSSHQLHVKTGLIQSFHKRASTICQEYQNLCNEISSLRRYHQWNGYP